MGEPALPRRPGGPVSMGFLFSKPAEAPPREPTPAEKAELEVRRAKVRITKAAKRTEAEALALRSRAKDLATDGRKEAALRLLKVRKLKMKKLDGAWGAILKLEEVLGGIETAKQQVELVDAMQAGADALRMINERIPAGRLEELLDETEEAFAFQRDVDDILSREMDGESLSEAQEALDALMRGEDAAPSSEADPAGAPSLPAVPTHEPVSLPAVPTGVVRPEAAEEEGDEAREAVPA